MKRYLIILSTALALGWATCIACGITAMLTHSLIIGALLLFIQSKITIQESGRS